VTLDKIDFSWPKKEDIDRWPPGVSLKSITFSTRGLDRINVSSVQCMLTNNESSPLFDAFEKFQFNKKTINFDASRPVKSVQARDDDAFGAFRITFLDRDGKEIDTFNPHNKHERAGEIHEMNRFKGIKFR